MTKNPTTTTVVVEEIEEEIVLLMLRVEISGEDRQSIMDKVDDLLRTINASRLHIELNEVEILRRLTGRGQKKVVEPEWMQDFFSQIISFDDEVRWV